MTVPKEFVHRASVAEVLLTDWERQDGSRFTVAAQWPRSHSFFTPVSGCHDPLIATETIRQAGVLICHTEFGVPLDHHFLMRDITVTVHPDQLLLGSTPATIELDIAFLDIKQQRGRLATGRLETVLRRDGHTAATGHASFTCTSPAVYQRIRGRRQPDHGCPQLPLADPVNPHTVGRQSPTDVVLSPTARPHHWQLRADTRHPVLFDHPVDHVPGMVLIEAARQATTATLGRACLPLRIETTFTRYAELDAPCTLHAQHLPAEGPHPHQTVLITGHQNDNRVFTSTVTVARPSA
jgi:hypothetical protein